MKNKAKPDDRRDNVGRIQNNINNTIRNYRETEDMINDTEDEEQKNNLRKKNSRREQSLNNMRKEIRDEAIDKKNGYK